MPNRSVIIILISTIVLIYIGLWTGNNVDVLPEVASANAPVYDQLFRVLLSIGTILFLGMLGLVIYSLIRFRRKPDQQGDGIALEGNLPLEIFWTAVPAIVVLFVGLYSYDIYERMGGMAPLHGSSHSAGMSVDQQRIWGGIGTGMEDNSLQPLPVEVTAQQFAFLFNYPQGDIISGELHVPIGRPVKLKMQSKDVIHAFWVPEFRLKQDVIPGQPTILNFTPTKTGRYPIICAELCGPYHGGMRSTVVVEDAEAFDEWFNKNNKKNQSQT